MTVMPVLPQVPVAAPTGMPVATATPQADPTSGFGALVAQLLGLAPSGEAVAAAVPATTQSTTGAPVPEDGAKAPDTHRTQLEDETVDHDDTDLDRDDLEPMLPTLGAALAAQLAVAALATRVNAGQLVATAPVTAPAADAEPGDLTVTATSPEIVTAASGTTETAAVVERPAAFPGVDTTQTTTASAAQGPADAEAPLTGTTEDAPVGAAPNADTMEAPAKDAPAVAAPAADAPAPAPASTPGGTPASTVGSLAQPAATTPAGVSTPPVAAEVHRQVFPEVTRLVSAGNGTHRITLELSPEALGEVKVTLIVRDGSVHVRLSAGDDAQRALLEGAPELRRLLEATGASDTKIVVRDLPSGSAPGGTAPSTPQGQADGGTNRHSAGSGGAGEQDASDRHAGTRGGGSTARDGISGGASTSRHVDQVTRARTTGLDVTM